MNIGLPAAVDSVPTPHRLQAASQSADGPPNGAPLRRLTVTSISTLFATALLVFGVVFWSVSRIDDLSQQRQLRTVQSALANSVAKVPYDQESVAIWNDAVLKLKPPLDLAWVESNLGVWMHEYFKHDRVHIVDAMGNPVYSMVDGKTVPTSRGEITPTLREAVSVLRQDMARGGLEAYHNDAGDLPRVVDLTFIDERPVLISAMPIVAESKELSPDAQSANVLISLRFLDESFLADLAKTHHLAGVRFSRSPRIAEHEQSYPLKNRAGTIIGYVVWDSERPGAAILEDVLPILASGLTAIGVAVLLLISGLRRTYRDLVSSEAESKHRAIRDPLTGLANRGYFNDRVAALLEERQRSEAPLALLFLDLDRFKQVNDTHGHAVGDALIQEIAQRIKSTLKPEDLLARIGGDEFAIVTCEGVSRDAIETLCRNIVASVSRPVEVLGQQASVGVSIGIGLSPEAGTERSELARNADIALYQAKHGGGAGYAFYTECMGRAIKERQALEADLRRALKDDGELEVVYQPLVSAKDFSVSGVEAFVRWNHPRLGRLLPTHFISIAEDCGLIDQLGERVLRDACRTAGALNLGTVAINVSATQFHQPEYAQRLLAILSQFGMDPQRLELEITERALLHASGTPARVLRELREKGVRIALDDFGTGYSSLSYLIKLEVDRIKLDRSFLQELGSCPRSSSVVCSIITMARAVGISVTAEGVETELQRDFLAAVDCDVMQGYLFAPPVSALKLVEHFSVGFRAWQPKPPKSSTPPAADPRVA